ncbi:MAG TPA: thiamine-phosphate kinase, partial [Bauldia sp.]|nr:thiamine-phosphate kinase [Bauldia sp.]
MAARRPGEFALIERYFRPLADNADAFGLTDDAALYRQRPGEDLVLTTDTVAAGIHFFADDPPDAIARKALRVNLSDLAAKGALPYGYLLALALPANWTEAWLRRFAGALAADQKTYGITLIGGDTTKARDGLSITITALGRVPKGEMVLRSGAEPGDVVFVSGTIGDAALGLRIRQGRLKLARGGKALVDRYLSPQPRVALAPVILRHASAALDVSDGLVGDLGHICDVSGVGAEIRAPAVPLSAAARAALDADPRMLGSILNGGDDYEILEAVPEREADAYVAEAADAGVPVARIGTILRGKGPPTVVDGRGKAVKVA